jgi:single-stranded DNA-binding protein
MPSFNRFLGIGHLTNHPELRYTTTGTPVLSGGFAMNRRFKRATTSKKKSASLTSPPGASRRRLTQRRWETDGQRHSKHEITVENFQLLKGKEDAHG